MQKSKALGTIFYCSNVPSLFHGCICTHWARNQYASDLDIMGIKSLPTIVLSGDSLCEQFETRSGPTRCRALSGSKLFYILVVFLKEFFEKVDCEKNQRTTKKHEKLRSRQRVKTYLNSHHR